ncbi:hypothetical protein [Nocardia terpenica]|uniref:Uncharacterized protein n=1 Tax=Nocardia terpenica TaxID=455432 RepID=A0A164JGV7_9NOCA|nr:hypothetical protein [Nocardia terpenica]KZM70393.1 hypothetical protein AWN90_03680 [Nocardia terpenica]NQE91076.1 hypothetical protein [Nocardia terpenica]
MITPARTVLKLFLAQRHWQSYEAFRMEWNKAAATVKPALPAPAERTFRRWKSGGLVAPAAARRRVLEVMFPGYTADQLFSPLPARRGLRPRHWESRGQISLFEVVA